MSEMSSSSPTPTNVLGDSMLCPVCFVMFDGRIMQCSQGHSVCEKCHRQLKNPIECPQCRSTYTGTRNYQLEEIIKQLQTLKQLAFGNSSTADAENGNNDHTRQILETFFKSITKPNDNEVTVSVAMDSSSEIEDNILVIMPPPATPPVILAPLCPQPPGLFECRMTNCDEKLPICRLLNHIRCFHKLNLLEARLPAANPEFNMHWTFPGASFRQAIQISKFGLFFFIVNVKKEQQTLITTAWVQCVCPNHDARKFTFQIEMRMGNQIGCFTDYVYGASSGATYIEEKSQCLRMEWPLRSNRKLGQIAADVKIVKTSRLLNLRRTNQTTLTLVENSTNE